MPYSTTAARLTTPATADVVVAGNVSDGISAQLSLGGSITGTVVSTDTIGGYSVIAFKEAGGAWQVAQEVTPTPANTYALRGLAPGVYHICLAPTDGGRDGHLPCYDEQAAEPPMPRMCRCRERGNRQY